jgi:hypothetical protein
LIKAISVCRVAVGIEPLDPDQTMCLVENRGEADQHHKQNGAEAGAEFAGD